MAKLSTKAMKFLKLFENYNNCDYFDMNSIYQHVEFDKPLYSVIAKRKTARLHYMSPKQYLYTIARQFVGLSYDDVVLSGAVNPDKYKEYAEKMKNGDKFPVSYYNRDSSMQEGRHRALAAMELGCEKIPVIEFIDLTKKEFEYYVDEYKDLSYEQINDIFINLGFKGITMLGYNNLENYIKYH